MNKPKQPCPKQCPNRNAECHAVCEKWLIYEAERNQAYIENGKEAEIYRVLNDIERDRKRDIATGKMKQRKRKK